MSEKNINLKPDHPESAPMIPKKEVPVTQKGTQNNAAAIEIVRGSLTTEFTAEDYKADFYGELDPDRAKEMYGIFSEMEKSHAAKIDLRPFIHGTEKYTVEQISLLENYAIYYFFLKNVIPTILKENPDDHLNVLDVGSGPTIYQFILMSALAGKIMPTEFDESNREVLKKWLTSGQEGWGSYLECLSQGIGESTSGITLEDDVRRRIDQFSASPDQIDAYLRQITVPPVAVDVFKKNLELPEEYHPELINLGREGGKYLLTSFFCVESAFTQDRARWQTGIENLANQLLPGGYLIMAAITGSDWYRDGIAKIPAVNVDGGDIAIELRNNSFEIISTLDMTGETEEEAYAHGRGSEYSGYSGMSFILAKKKN